MTATTNDRGSHGRARPARWVAGLAAAGLLLTGCSTGGPSGNADASSTAPPTSSVGDAKTPPAGQEGLAAFYGQQAAWEKCQAAGDTENATCAWVEVPVDYANPAGEKTKLRVLRVPAEGKTSRGALFVNPGGPGGSATQYAGLADVIVSSEIRKNFDIVGVDPRGVGESQPIACVDPAGVDRLLGMDPTPDDQAEDAELTATAAAFGAACKKKYPSLLPHVSTVDAAKDTDIVRAVLGQAQLTYLGKSYGTYLGTVYAGLFPARAGRMVLDGAISPSLTNDEMNLGQAQGFETATRAYVDYCVEQGNCPLGSTSQEAMTGLRTFLEQVDAKPLPVSGDPRVTQLTEGWASTGLAQAMYAQELWDGLTDALRTAKQGSGDGLFSLAEQYAGREGGTYNSNIMQVLPAVNCLDRPTEPMSLTQMEQKEAQFAQKAPTWGPYMAWGSSTCETWPVPATGKPQKITAAGSGPILVVGTTRDPATPYQWAQRLAGELENGHLLTRDGDGHTGYYMQNTCIDKAVDAYWLEGKVPADGAKC